MEQNPKEQQKNRQENTAGQELEQRHAPQDGMLVEQPHLGKKGMVLLITLCNAIAPLSTDMYMPALPEMKGYFHTSDAVMNLTLVGFFLFFALGMLLFGPVLSPLIGAFIYKMVGWRMVFVAQGAITLIVLVVAILMRETLQHRLDQGILHSLSRLGVVIRNRTFALFLLGIIFLQAPMMAYIGASSYVYQDFFGLSPSLYSIFFAGTALASVLGPVLYAMVRRANAFRVSYVLFLATAVCGILLLLVGHARPAAFALLMAPMMMCAAASRPFATTILLNLQEKDAGAASSLINFSFTLMGTIGMFMITGVWKDYILGLGILMVAAAACGAVLITALRQCEGKEALHFRRP